MDVIVEDIKFKPNKPRVLHRVVVNDKTFSIFDNFVYQTIDLSIVLKDLTIESIKDVSDCALVLDTRTKRSVTVCAPQYYPDDHSKLILEFKQKVEFFRDKCDTDFKVIDGKIS